MTALLLGYKLDEFGEFLCGSKTAADITQALGEEQDEISRQVRGRESSVMNARPE